MLTRTIIENLPENDRFFIILLGLFLAFVFLFVFIVYGVLSNLIESGILGIGVKNQLELGNEVIVESILNKKKLKFVSIKERSDG